jgi:hypothetical protein
MKGRAPRPRARVAAACDHACVPDRETCVGCGVRAPATDTNYTLISSKHGWRLLRRALGDGEYALDWRCRECWRAYKREMGDALPPSGSHSVRPPSLPASEKMRSAPAASSRPPARPPARRRDGADGKG